MSSKKSNWFDLIKVYKNPAVISLVFLGFSAGLPFLLVFSTLSAWLRDEGVSLSVIGFFSWVGITYSIKVFWAPVVDSLKIPLLSRLLGKRRSWMLLAQFGIMGGLIGMSVSDTQSQLQQIAIFAVLVAFFSATQDIVVDAYRIEAADSRLQGAMAASYVLGYRIALLVAGAGAFYIAEASTWIWSYRVMSLAMLVGVVTTLLIKEPDAKVIEVADGVGGRLRCDSQFGTKFNYIGRVTVWFSVSVVGPFVDFFERNGRVGLLILGLIALYKMSDITMGVMANPFYLDLGFSKTQIADVTKVFGFFMTILGASLGGVLVLRYGLMKPLLLGAVLVSVTNLLFACLAVSEPNLLFLAAVVSADNLSGGVATSIFIAYLSSLTSTAYTATQYALFSSLMTFPAKLMGGGSGLIVELYGYSYFFVYASLLGIPAILLVMILMRVNRFQECNP